MSGRLDHPSVSGAIVGVATAAFLLVRLVVAGHGQIAGFIMAERPFVSPSLGAHGIPVLPRNGYDGQFFYRLALDPADLHHSAFGIHLDTVFRLQRIGYPFLAWLLSLGHHRWVPTTLVVVNVVAMAVLGALGGSFARDAGRHALWGLLVAGYWGFVFSVARDLSEPTAAAFLLAGVLAYRRGRPVLCGVLLACGSLTRETVLLAVAVLVVHRVVTVAARRARFGPADLAWVLPVVAFAGWQIRVHAVIGQYPIVADETANSAGPLRPLVHSIDLHLRAAAMLNADAVIWVIEIIALAVVILAALTTLRSTSATGAERMMFGTFFLLLFFLSPSIWDGTVDLRSLDEVYLFAVLLLLGNPRRDLRVMAAVVIPVVVIVAAHRVVSL